MKKNIKLSLLFIMLSILLTNCISSPNIVAKTLGDHIHKAENSTWQLIWQDEFTKSNTLEDNWYIDNNENGGGNQELQYYTDRAKNVYIEDGMLHIVGLKEHYFTREYTSARLFSIKAWTYGRFEARAKLPEGKGIWPAIWLISDAEPYGPWPASGEIDIMEMLGHEPTIIYGTLHYTDALSNHEQLQGTTTLTSEEFHIFALEWEKHEFRFFVDGQQYFSVNSWNSDAGAFPAPYDQPFNIILNLAIGGVWPGNPNEDTVFPQEFVIDYVRVYQKNNSK